MGRGEVWGVPIVGVAERRRPKMKINPELWVLLTLLGWAQEENQGKRTLKGGVRVGVVERERLGKTTILEIKEVSPKRVRPSPMSDAVSRLHFEDAGCIFGLSKARSELGWGCFCGGEKEGVLYGSSGEGRGCPVSSCRGTCRQSQRCCQSHQRLLD